MSTWRGCGLRCISNTIVYLGWVADPVLQLKRTQAFGIHPSQTRSSMSAITGWQSGAEPTPNWSDGTIFAGIKSLHDENTDEFDRYSLGVLLYCQEQKGIPSKPKLERERERQTKLYEWKEYYIYEHEKLNGLERKVQRIQQLFKNQQCLHVQLWRANNDLKAHRTLLNWIEEQMSSVVAERDSANQYRKSRRAYQKQETRLALSNSRSQKQLQGLRRNRVRLTASAVLKPVHASHVSKPIQKKKLLNRWGRKTQLPDSLLALPLCQP